jgi:hypothetical protein
VALKTGFGLDDWICCTFYIHTNWEYRPYSAIADLPSFSSPLHTHWDFQSLLAVSWQRIYHSLTVTQNRM